MSHVEAQASYQLVRCDIADGQVTASTAERLAEVIKSGVVASAQARLRWQLAAAAEVLAQRRDVETAALCLAIAGFADVPTAATDQIDEATKRVGVEQAATSSLLEIAALAVQALGPSG